MLKNTEQLNAYLQNEARNIGLHLAFNTHYDAGNWQLTWWRGAIFHRLDIQPMESGDLAVIHYRDQFRWFPRILYWAHKNVPLFPYCARMSWSHVGKIRLPVEENVLGEFISRSLNDE